MKSTGQDVARANLILSSYTGATTLKSIMLEAEEKLETANWSAVVPYHGGKRAVAGHVSLSRKRRSHQQGRSQQTDLQESEAEAQQGRNFQLFGQEGGFGR